MTVVRKISRRRLLRHALGAAAAGSALPLFTSCRKEPTSGPSDAKVTSGGKKKTPGPNDRIGVGIIGCGRRNGQLVVGKGGQKKPPKDIRIVGVADHAPQP